MAEPNKKKLSGKVAIITGGASGIGEAAARLLADHGASMVVIADIQDQVGQDVATSIGTNKCSYVHCDVTKEEQVKSLVEWTVQSFGKLDIMFSNAGILGSSEQTVLDLDLSAFDHLFAINVRGMATCVKYAARAMVEGGVRGSIVCTASVGGSRGFRMRTDYTMSKHAVVGLVRAASVQLGGHGIRVNSVSPYGVATPMTMNVYNKSAEEVESLYEPNMTLKGVATKARNIADAVLFLACDESAVVTGHDLVVDGGFLTR
ncbi:(+)-cis,cis-nepetalactol synthase NEPS3 [Ricinus communis]|uniref:Short chain alcohol dehydrogenase, putative n=1 Tax=Ricinus communis TaxID=3988 RepID=B9R941_RICCO|nr:(+)-cis,cis-nepetalactol synthase NEPS3 [Ricinus communis]EEF52118.1 short chain alcohol dehydrogenase, putative [Ricinus communis]|eukprot:XP_002511516.1 (-)-isopiperitenol/(-)-carveol dehydrogenase, mitochondrial [Ricinus communis]